MAIFTLRKPFKTFGSIQVCILKYGLLLRKNVLIKKRVPPHKYIKKLKRPSSHKMSFPVCVCLFLYYIVTTFTIDNKTKVKTKHFYNPVHIYIYFLECVSTVFRWLFRVVFSSIFCKRELFQFRLQSFLIEAIMYYYCVKTSTMQILGFGQKFTLFSITIKKKKKHSSCSKSV